jgi:hypothetical protein
MTQDEWREIIEILFDHWNPFPSRSYCEKVGWEANPDGTVETPFGCIPTSDLCEIRELEALYRK